MIFKRCVLFSLLHEFVTFYIVVVSSFNNKSDKVCTYQQQCPNEETASRTKSYNNVEWATTKASEFDNCIKCSFRGLTNFQQVIKECSTTWKRLDLSINNIESLPPYLFNGSMCQNIVDLKICINKIEGYIVPFAFFGLSKLERLNLTYNHIKGIAVDGLAGMNNLQYLSLGKNSITHIFKNSFQGVSKTLIFLDLKYNNISIIEPGSFYWCKSILNLTLYDNRLRQIQNGVFTDLSELRILDLSLNKITCIYDGSFISNSNLETLLLDYNEITYLSTYTFAGLTNLRELSLLNNPVQTIQADAFCYLRNQLNTLFVSMTSDSQAMLQKSILVLDDRSTVYNNGKRVLINNYLDDRGSMQCLDVKFEKNDVLTGDNSLSQKNSTFWINNGIYIAQCRQIDRRNNLPSDSPFVRHHLLIIIAVCVAFLLTTFAIILTYNGWRKSTKFSISTQKICSSTTKASKKNSAIGEQQRELLPQFVKMGAEGMDKCGTQNALKAKLTHVAVGNITSNNSDEGLLKQLVVV